VLIAALYGAVPLEVKPQTVEYSFIPGLPMNVGVFSVE
jgi:hypothetical protein